MDEDRLVVCTLINPLISSSRYCSRVAVRPGIWTARSPAVVAVSAGSAAQPATTMSTKAPRSRAMIVIPPSG